MEVRPYDPERDPEALWELKRRFELELGGDAGDDRKRRRYEAKLDPSYRERYLAWVERCVADDPRCVTVAQPRVGEAEGDGMGERDGNHVLAGYVFVLPERLSMIWDAAVLNELYVRRPRRGTGLADRLMDAAVELAGEQELPLDRLVLDVDRENERARAFYERHGFSHWGEMVAREL